MFLKLQDLIDFKNILKMKNTGITCAVRKEWCLETWQILDSSLDKRNDNKEVRNHFHILAVPSGMSGSSLHHQGSKLGAWQWKPRVQPLDHQELLGMPFLSIIKRKTNWTHSLLFESGPFCHKIYTCYCLHFLKMFFIIIILQNNSAAYLILLSLGLTAAEKSSSLTNMLFISVFPLPSNSSTLFFTPQSEYLLARIKRCSFFV